jgi:hypothetical protein
MTRACDGCDLCCTAVGVEALKKPPGVACKHLTSLMPVGHNCLIYGGRPGGCEAFRCLWLGADTAFGDDYFPASCGFVMAFNNVFQWPFVITVHPDPKRPEAWNRQPFLDDFASLAWDLNCMVAIGQGETATHVISPKGWLYAKTDFPKFFLGGGESVGVPDFDFREGVRPTLAEIGRRLRLGP